MTRSRIGRFSIRGKVSKESSSRVLYIAASGFPQVVNGRWFMIIMAVGDTLPIATAAEGDRSKEWLGLMPTRADAGHTERPDIKQALPRLSKHSFERRMEERICRNLQSKRV